MKEYTLQCLPLKTVILANNIKINGYNDGECVWFDIKEIMNAFSYTNSNTVRGLLNNAPNAACYKRYFRNSNNIKQTFFNLFGILELALVSKKMEAKDVLDYWSTPGKIDEAFNTNIVSYSCPPKLYSLLNTIYENRIVSHKESERARRSAELWERKETISPLEYKKCLLDIYGSEKSLDYIVARSEYRKWYSSTGYKIFMSMEDNDDNK